MNDLALCPCEKRDGSRCNSNLADNNFTHFIGCKSHGYHLKHHNVLEDSILGCCIDGLRSRIIRGQAGAYLNDDKRPRAQGNLRVNIPCTPGQFNEEHSFFAPGNQADGFIVYNGHLDEDLFHVIRNRLGPNPNHNPNTLQNRKEAFHRLLDHCFNHNLKLEHWDVHFCQGSSKQLKSNERTKARLYATAWDDFCQQEENGRALQQLRDLNPNSGGAPSVSLIGMSLSGAFSEGATDFITRMATIKFPTPISDSTLSHLPARSRWMDWTMRTIQRNVLESIGAAITSETRLWKATAPTALHRDNMTENTEWRYYMWPTGSRRSTSSELDIPPEISIYSDHGGDHFEPNIRLEEHNSSRGHSSNTPHDARASIPHTDGQLRNILPDMESNDLDDQVRNTQLDVEPIDIEYLLANNQRVVNFLTAGTQEDKQRFIDLLNAKIDREWEVQKAASTARRTPRRTTIDLYLQDLGIDPSLIRPTDTATSSRKNKSRQGITIRTHKQPVSIGQSSNSRVNRTDSAHSINARSASNMIPCFPANNSTDVHHYDIVSSRSSPSHFTNDTPLNISKVRTRSTTKKLNHCLENQIGYNLRNRNTGKCSCCNSSQDD